MKYTALMLTGFIVFVFILQTAVPGFTEFMLLVPAAFAGYELITHMFIHAGFVHLFYNLFALALFGTILNTIIGDRRFLVVFFTAGLIAGLSAFVFYADSAVLGASGAIMGIMGCLGVLRPKMNVWVMGAPMPMIAAVGIWAFIDLAGLIGGSHGIANGAHLFGLASGILFGFYFYRKYKSGHENDRHKTKKIIDDVELDRWEDEWMH